MGQSFKISHDELIRLEGKITSKFPDTVFEKGVSCEEIDRFEKNTQIKLPNALVTFYKWHNGIKKQKAFEVLSLQGALSLFKKLNTLPNEIYQKILKEKITSFSPSSEYEVEAFLKGEAFEQNNTEIAELWLPFLILPSAEIYCISIKKTPDSGTGNLFTSLPNTKIQLENIDSIFEYLPINKKQVLITDSFFSIVRIFENYIDPPKRSFKKRLKDFFRDIKSALDSIS